MNYLGHELFAPSEIDVNTHEEFRNQQNSLQPADSALAQRLMRASARYRDLADALHSDRWLEFSRDNNQSLPAGVTYLAQFLAHDVFSRLHPESISGPFPGTPKIAWIPPWCWVPCMGTARALGPLCTSSEPAFRSILTMGWRLHCSLLEWITVGVFHCLLIPETVTIPILMQIAGVFCRYHNKVVDEYNIRFSTILRAGGSCLPSPGRKRSFRGTKSLKMTS